MGTGEPAVPLSDSHEATYRKPRTVLQNSDATRLPFLLIREYIKPQKHGCLFLNFLQRNIPSTQTLPLLFQILRENQQWQCMEHEVMLQEAGSQQLVL